MNRTKQTMELAKAKFDAVEGVAMIEVWGEGRDEAWLDLRGGEKMDD